VTGQNGRRGGPADALESDLQHGRAFGFHRGLPGGWTADDGFVRGLRDQPQDGLQVAFAVRRGGSGGAARAVARSASSGARARSGDRGGDRRAAWAVSVLGAAQAEGASGACPRARAMAGGEQHRGSAQAPRAGRRAAPAAACAAGDAALLGGARPQRPLVRRLQGLVPHPRRDALRSAHAQRRAQPVSPVLRHRRADARGRGAGLRAGLPRIRPAAGAAHGQRPALRLDGRGRAEPSRGGMAEARDPAGADRSGQAAAERTARAHAPHAQAGDLGPGCRDAGAAAGALRPVPRGLQRDAPARGALYRPERW
jgi:hypothetical protein